MTKKVKKFFTRLILTAATVATPASAVLAFSNPQSQSSVSQSQNLVHVNSSFRSRAVGRTLTKPSFSSVVRNVIYPYSSTSPNAVVEFTVTGFDPNTMEFVNKDDGTLGTFDASTKTIRVSGLVQQEHATVEIAPKGTNAWTGGGANPSATTQIIKNTYIGVPLPVVADKRISIPTSTATSWDGEIEFEINGFDDSKMIILDNGSGNGSWGTGASANIYTVTGLKSGEIAAIGISPIPGQYVWEKPTDLDLRDNLQMAVTTTKEVSLPIIKPPVETTTTHSSTSTDGEVTFTLDGFFDSIMEIKNTGDGNSGTFDPITKTYKVTGLVQGETASIEISPKPGNIWIRFDPANPTVPVTHPNPTSSLTITANTNEEVPLPIIGTPTESNKTHSGTSTDGEITFPITGYDANKMKITKTGPGTGTFSGGKFVVTGLKQNESVSIEISPLTTSKTYVWPSASDVNPTSSKSTAPNGTSEITLPTIGTPTLSKLVHSSTSTDGEITFPITNFDPTTMVVKKTADGVLQTYDSTTKTIKVGGLKSGETASIEISPLLGFVWSNVSDTNPTSTLSMVSNTDVIVLLPTISNPLETKKASFSTSKDAVVEFTISSNYDPTKMEIINDGPGNGTYDVTTNKYTVNGLQQSQEAKIKIVPKTGFVWPNASDLDPTEKVKTTANSKNGVKKPTISNPLETNKAQHSTSLDATVTFDIADYNPGKMGIYITAGNGFGAFDFTNNAYVVNGLKQGETVTIEIRPNRGVVWFSGGSNPTETLQTIANTNIGIIKPGITGIAETVKATSSTSTDAEVKFTIVGFDSSTMDITSSAGTGVYKNGDYVVSGLTQNQKVNVRISPKSGHVWFNSSDTDPTISKTTTANTDVGVVVPTITGKKETKAAYSSTSADAEVTFTITGYDPGKMDIINNSTGTGTFNNGKYVITGLSQNENVFITISPKINFTWSKKTDTDPTGTITTTSNIKSTVQVPVITKTEETKKAYSPTSSDGEVTFTITGYDPANMVINKTSTPGTLGSFSGNVLSGTVVITGLKAQETASIEISTASNSILWSNSSDTDPTSSITTVQNNKTSVTLPSIAGVGETIRPSTSVSSDGEVTFTITGFDSTKMTITKSGPGTLGTFSGTTGTGKVVVKGLKQNETVSITISLKTNFIWTSQSDTDPTSSITTAINNTQGISVPIITKSEETTKAHSSSSQDAVVVFTITGYDPAKMTLTKSGSGIGTYSNGKFTVTNLRASERVSITISPKSTYVWTSSVADPTSAISTTANNNTGIFLPTVSNPTEKNKAYSSTSTDAELQFRILGFNPSTMNITSSAGTGSFVGSNYVVSGLTQFQKITITITPKTGHVWSNASDSDISKDGTTSKVPGIEVSVPVITKATATKQTHSSTTTDGEATFTITGFDSTKMTIIKFGPGTGIYSNGKYVVTGLRQNENVSITISPKSGYLWSNPSDTDPNDSVRLQQNFTTSVDLPIISKAQETKAVQHSTAKDAEVTFTITGFESSSMIIASTGAGNLGTFRGNSTSGTIVVSGLGQKEIASIKISPAPNILWTNTSDIDPESSKIVSTSTKVGISAPAITNAKETKVALDSTSPNAEITFTITGYDASKMEIVKTGSGTGKYSSGKYVVTGLRQSQTVTITIKPKSIYVWLSSSTPNPISTKRTSGVNTKAIKAPTITGKKETKTAYSSNSVDGEVTFTIAGFNGSTMDIRDTGSGHGSFVGNSYKVTGLKQSQTASIEITPKHGNIWIGASTINPTDSLQISANTKVEVPAPRIISTRETKTAYSSTSTDVEVTFTIAGYDASKMEIKNTGKGAGTFSGSSYVVTGLKQNEVASIEIAPKTGFLWRKGTSKNPTAKIVTRSNNYLETTVPTIGTPTETNFASSSTTRDSEVTFPITGYNPSKMIIKILSPRTSPAALGTFSNGKYVIKGLMQNQKVEIEIVPKSRYVWAPKGTNDPSADMTTKVNNKVALKDPNDTWKYKTRETNVGDNNGEIELRISNWNSTWMKQPVFDPSWKHNSPSPKITGSNGIFVITGLTENDQPVVKVTLKTGAIWLSGGTDPVLTSTVKMSYARKSLIKPTIVSSSLKYSEGEYNTYFGEITYKLDNFDPTTMVVKPLVQGKGTVLDYDPTTKTVKIIDVPNRDEAKIVISVRDQLINEWKNNEGNLIHSTLVNFKVPSQKLSGMTLALLIFASTLAGGVGVWSVYRLIRIGWVRLSPSQRGIRVF